MKTEQQIKERITMLNNLISSEQAEIREIEDEIEAGVKSISRMERLAKDFDWHRERISQLNHDVNILEWVLRG